MSQKATVQSKLSFTTSVKRPRKDDDYEPETSITQSVEVTTEVTTADTTPLAPAKEDSATLKELRHVTKSMARDTLRQLEIGYSPRSSGQVAAAIRNEIQLISIPTVPKYPQLPHASARQFTLYTLLYLGLSDLVTEAQFPGGLARTLSPPIRIGQPTPLRALQWSSATSTHLRIGVPL